MMRRLNGSRTSFEDVASISAVQDIVPAVASQDVIAAQSVKRVATRTAFERVTIPSRSDQEIIAVLAEKDDSDDDE